MKNIDLKTLTVQAAIDMHLCPLLTPRVIYKPFLYPECHKAWQTQQLMHWMPEEVPMADDVRCWAYNLTDNERNFITQIFRLFAQSDIAVHNCYLEHYSKVFQPIEVKMMLTSFQNMESCHTHAYAYLIDTLCLPDTMYSDFLEYQEMRDKWDLWMTCKSDTLSEFAVTLATFGGLIEGMVLFSSFVMLLNFSRFNKMKGMSQIIAWSVRDESLHTQSMCMLFKTLMSEIPELWTDELRQTIIERTKSIVLLEDKFIELAFATGGIEGLTIAEMQNHIRTLADEMLGLLGLSPIYFITNDPVRKWVNHILYGMEFVNFFENRSTDYAKATTVGQWSEVKFES